ncbi:MAG: aldo/keto reductase [Solibacterales bacterium]|nr:aldo/keto reductase [Bryobacterales bacterium]|tara:strand:+ start:8176 stop:9162 length:987 start_codon:yes stop_codon:yes gene_type:complete
MGATLMISMSQCDIAQKNRPGGIPTRRLGRTNEQVSILCLGGAHLGRAGEWDKQEAVRIAHTAIDNGVTFFDNAWAYLDGWAEECMGLALDRGWRKKVFLMTKNSGRDYGLAKKCLDDSLRRLRTDYIDLWQFHEINYDNDPEWVFEKGGLKFALEAQKAGKIRFIGFTGHKDPRIHQKMLNKGFEWATAQMPINVMDYFYRSFQRDVLPLCLSGDVGVLGMKSLGGGVTQAKIPLDTTLTAEQCVRYALSQPISTLVRGYTKIEQLEADISIAQDFAPLSLDQQRDILAIAETDAGDGRHEHFKSTRRFDNPIYREMHGLPVTGDSL